jgi:hypothetical protein
MKTTIIALVLLALGVSSVLAQTPPRHIDLQLIAETVKKPVKPHAQTLKAPGGSGPARQIPHGGCCATVHNHCVTICNKSGGCTGSGDCIVNPN